MIKGFPIDFVRQLIEQELLKMHKENPNYIGGTNEVSLLSFYEQLQKEEEVNRYVEIYRDLTEQQNRTGLIMNGTIISPENPTITNSKFSTIIPQTFTCSFRVKLADRDRALNTINELIERLKGKSHDIAQFDNGQLFVVGKVGNTFELEQEGTYSHPYIKSGDFIGMVNTTNLDTQIKTKITYFDNTGIRNYMSQDSWVYFEDENEELCVAVLKRNQSNQLVWTKVEDDGTYQNIIFPPVVDEFTKYQLSINFESVRCDEPRTLNADEYCVISFGGSSTLANEYIKLGNNLIGVNIRRYEIVGTNAGFQYDTLNNSWYEPLELPSGNNADTQVSRLLNNKFMTNSHTNGLNVSLQYTFILDMSRNLISKWFEYARYGKQPTISTDGDYLKGITPNMVYNVYELWSSWGEVEPYEVKAKIVESIDIENTEGDILTITIPFQVQGDNN